ncbi:MAG: S1 RNA-binding domain-containing protein [Acidobacteria bacterium]|nr:S1 RNA-binding domain-containing protein [Acidobacteriota bacterium]
MKPLTGLPPSAYLKITEEAKIPLALLEQLVQELESGSTPAYLAHFRPDVSGGLDEPRIRFVENRLRQFMELEDRRITVLTAAGQRDCLTLELRAQIEAATDRWELEDFYLPLRPKRETAADRAIKQGLDGLAKRLAEQNPADRDLNAIAAEYLKPEADVSSTADALRGAREILAQSWCEDAGVRRGLRAILRQEAWLVITGNEAAKKAAQGKYKNLVGYHARLPKVAWRQMMALRRAVREIGLGFEIVLSENKTVAFLLEKKVAQPSPEILLQLGSAAVRALEGYLAPSFTKELAQVLNERCDDEAVESFQKSLRKILMAPPAGPIGVAGIETGRPGGWRAAIISADGEFVEGAIIQHEGREESKPGREAVSTDAANERPAAETADSHTPDHSGEEGLTAAVGGDEDAESRAEAAASGGEPAPDEGVSAAGEAPDTQPRSAASEQETSSEARLAVPTEKTADSGSVAPGGPVALADASAGVESSAVASEEKVEESPAEDSREDAMPGRPVSTSNGSVSKESFTPLADLLKRHEVGAIVMAGSPGVRQVEKLVRSSIRESGQSGIFWTTVNEAGSWIHAASKTSRREMPGTSVAQRSAACLAKRLQDPLTALAGVDPRTLGIGQFHHDVDARKLREGLSATLEVVAHRVGTNLNSASIELLALVPGMTERVAKRVVEHRVTQGKFSKREQLADVSGLSKRIYKQAVGFTRVYGGENPFDGTGIHPDQYPAVEKILGAAGISAAEALDKPEVLDSVDLSTLQAAEHPVEVLQGIVRQFRPAVRNPRGEFKRPDLGVELRTDNELKIGAKIEGVVTNVAAFGVFVDIGADQDGLVHVSRMSDTFVKDPKAATRAGEKVEVYIVALEDSGKRISLSMRDPARAQPRPGRTRVDARKTAAAPPKRRRKEPTHETKATPRSFGPSEKERHREEQDMKKLSLAEKLALLQSKYRTKV